MNTLIYPNLVPADYHTQSISTSTNTPPSSLSSHKSTASLKTPPNSPLLRNYCFPIPTLSFLSSVEYQKLITHSSIYICYKISLPNPKKYYIYTLSRCVKDLFILRNIVVNTFLNFKVNYFLLMSYKLYDGYFIEYIA
jgi:hypothetical protein